MNLEGFLLNVTYGIGTQFIIIFGEYMSLSEKNRTNYELAKKVYIFGFVFMFAVFGFNLFQAKGLDKITPAVFLIISMIAWLYVVIKNPYRKVFAKILNNPSHFVEINIEALKAHLVGWANYESYKNIINKVILYRPSFESKTPTLVKYILYFDVKYNKETESTRKIFEEFIVRKLPIIGDEFKNVYKNTIPDNHIDKWELTLEKPEGVNEEYSFVLFP